MNHYLITARATGTSLPPARLLSDLISAVLRTPGLRVTEVEVHRVEESDKHAQRAPRAASPQQTAEVSALLKGGANE